MAKKQHCLMCGEILYEMTRYGEPVERPPSREDPAYGTLVVCPECGAEHLTWLDDKLPDVPAIRRIRGLKPPE